MTAIDTRAVVDPRARIGSGCQIGPYCVIGPNVTLGEGVRLHAHVVLAGHTTVGAGTSIFPFAALGHAPQDLKYRGEDASVSIGAECTIREGVTIHPGTAGGGSITTIGDRCTLLAGAHVGHDCTLGDDVVLSNNVMLAGHVSVGRRAILGGGVGVHQFVRVGEMAFVGGLSGLEGDLIPFGLALGNRAHFAGLNLVGLRRHRVSSASVALLRGVVSAIFASGATLTERLASAQTQFGNDGRAAAVIAFVQQGGRRPLCRPLALHSASQ